MADSRRVGDTFVVEGGRPVEGTVNPAGNKNEALPALAATLLAPGESVLDNVPRILDVETLVEILVELGVSVAAEEGQRRLRIETSAVSERRPSRDLSRTIRGSFLLAPGLLHRTGRGSCFPRPGGDRIGRRRIDTHLHCPRAARRARSKPDEREYLLEPRRRASEGATSFSTKRASWRPRTRSWPPSVAERPDANRRTRRQRAARAAGCVELLVRDGSPNIDGHRNATSWRSRAWKRCTAPQHRIGPDHIEVGSFIAIAAMTGGELRTWTDVEPDDLRMIRLVFARLGRRPPSSRATRGALGARPTRS